MAIRAHVRRYGHSSGGAWWDDDSGGWVAAKAAALPFDLPATPELEGVYTTVLLNASSRGDETHYVVEVTDTEDPTVRDTHIITVDASPVPDQVVEYTTVGDHGPTTGTRATTEGPTQTIDIEYDSQGRRSKITTTTSE